MSSSYCSYIMVHNRLWNFTLRCIRSNQICYNKFLIFPCLVSHPSWFFWFGVFLQCVFLVILNKPLFSQSVQCSDTLFPSQYPHDLQQAKSFAFIVCGSHPVISVSSLYLLLASGSSLLMYTEYSITMNNKCTKMVRGGNCNPPVIVVPCIQSESSMGCLCRTCCHAAGRMEAKAGNREK